MAKTTLHIDEESKILKAVVSGEFEAMAGQQFIVQCRLQAAEKGLNLLYDLRDMVLTASVSQLYNLIKQAPEFKDPKVRNVKVSLLIQSNAPNRETLDFYEMAGSNDGLMIKVFSEEQQAIDWLR